MDKFPEAFSRFEKIMHVENVKNFHQLELMFAEWAGHNWIPTSRQTEALRREASKHGIVSKGKFSSKYAGFGFWMAQRPRTSRYQHRVTSYMSRYPYATLEEARGHHRRR